MKNILLIVCMIACTKQIFSQWQLSLSFKEGETIRDISAVNNKIIWTITGNFFIYRTNNGGDNWKKVKCKGLEANVSILQLYVVNDSAAFLCLNKSTGTGPGLLYKTTDSGSTWKKVFSHKGNCNIILGMFNNSSGIMACSFDSFDGSVRRGVALYKTNNQGYDWIRNSANPAKGTILNLEVNANTVAMTDYRNFYWSSNRGNSFPVISKLRQPNAPKYYLQFEDSNYAILNSNNNVDILVKRPGTQGWIDEGMPPGIDNGFITAIVLDDNECWMTAAFDTNKLYYSSDSAKTFTSTVPLANSSFQFLVKARKGRMLVGGTPSFMTGKIYINKRNTNHKDYPVASLNTMRY